MKDKSPSEVIPAKSNCYQIHIFCGWLKILNLSILYLTSCTTEERHKWVNETRSWRNSRSSTKSTGWQLLKCDATGRKFWIRSKSVHLNASCMSKSTRWMGSEIATTNGHLLSNWQDKSFGRLSWSAEHSEYIHPVLYACSIDWLVQLAAAQDCVLSSIF